MSSCAIETCERSAQRGGPGCDMCDRVAMLPQPQIRDAQRQGRNVARDGARPDKDSTPLAFKKRHRVGPHR